MKLGLIARHDGVSCTHSGIGRNNHVVGACDGKGRAGRDTGNFLSQHKMCEQYEIDEFCAKQLQHKIRSLTHCSKCKAMGFQEELSKITSESHNSFIRSCLPHDTTKGSGPWNTDAL